MLIGVAAWLVVAVTIAVLVGRIVARRERQVPRPQVAVEIPEQSSPPPSAPVLRLGRRR